MSTLDLQNLFDIFDARLDLTLLIHCYRVELLKLAKTVELSEIWGFCINRCIYSKNKLRRKKTTVTIHGGEFQSRRGPKCLKNDHIWSKQKATVTNGHG